VRARERDVRRERKEWKQRQIKPETERETDGQTDIKAEKWGNTDREEKDR